jgi:alkanesulfonate monooxygenase SsuD/methylene tetrahydromethanopterin reductase-like flavin-dependent oxidoreductase (luciferase family)
VTQQNIKFGWCAPGHAGGDDDNTAFADQIISVIECVKGGFDSIWVSDHFHPASGGNDEAGVLECMTTLSYLAGAFPQLDFGNAVLCQSFRNPALLAKMGATLQMLTHGRFILGIGAGWKEDEYLAYGYDFPKASVRIAQLNEAVQIVRKMWTETPASFEGQYYHIQDAYCEPKPRPRPPIMIGGGGEKLTLRVVARLADWWNLVFVDINTYAHKLSVLRSHCESVGRSCEEIVKVLGQAVVIAETEAEAKRIAKASRWKPIVGTPAQIVDQLQPFIELGVEYFILAFRDFPNPRGSILFAEEVIPQLRQGG